MRDRYGATNPRAQQLRFHTQTAGSTLTAQQPANNIVRVALQALSAVLGGTQSLHCNGSDEALGLPTEQSATVALRTQQILLHESGVAQTVDPFGGAYAIESRHDPHRGGSRKPAGTDPRHGRDARGPRVGLRPTPHPRIGVSRAAGDRRRHVGRRRREPLHRRDDGRAARLPDRSGDSRRRRLRGSAPCAPGAAPRRVRRRWPPSTAPHAAARTWCRPSSRPSSATPRWARSQIHCGPSSAKHSYDSDSSRSATPRQVLLAAPKAWTR